MFPGDHRSSSVTFMSTRIENKKQNWHFSFTTDHTVSAGAEVEWRTWCVQLFCRHSHRCYRLLEVQQVGWRTEWLLNHQHSALIVHCPGRDWSWAVGGHQDAPSSFSQGGAHSVTHVEVKWWLPLPSLSFSWKVWHRAFSCHRSGIIGSSLDLSMFFSFFVETKIQHKNTHSLSLPWSRW